MNFAANHDALVTLGIKPTRPDTGYGYIQFNPELDGSGLHRVKTFTEKPSEDIAKSFLESGEFLWNAGIFVWSMKAINRSIEQHIPEIHQIFAEVDTLSPNYSDQLEQAYSLTPSISIDYGVLEKESEVFVMPANFGWNDLGTWKSLWDVSDRNEKNNAIVGKNVHVYNTTESLVFNNSQKLIVVNGVDNIVIVESDEVLLVMNKDKEQELKTIVNEIKDRYKGKFN
jgi:mannose-1-phosphate guanylyltransferase